MTSIIYLYFTPSKTGGLLSGEFSEETFVRRWCNLKQIEGYHFLEMCDFLGHFFGRKIENLRFFMFCFILKPCSYLYRIRLGKLLGWSRSFLKSLLKHILFSFFFRNVRFFGSLLGPKTENLRFSMLCFMLKPCSYFY